MTYLILRAVKALIHRLCTSCLHIVWEQSYHLFWKTWKSPGILKCSGKSHENAKSPGIFAVTEIFWQHNF